MPHDEIADTAVEKQLDNASPALLLKLSLNWLLVFLPITLALERISNLPPQPLQ